MRQSGMGGMMMCLSLTAVLVSGCGTSSLGANTMLSGEPVETSTSAAPQPVTSTSETSSEVQALEAAFASSSLSIRDSVVVKGSFALAPAVDGTSSVGAAAAIATASKSPAMAQALSESKSPTARLALFSYYPPGATNLPIGADTSQSLQWIVLLAGVPDLAAPAGGAPAPGVSALPPKASTVDLVTLVDATSGALGETYALG